MIRPAAAVAFVTLCLWTASCSAPMAAAASPATVDAAAAEPAAPKQGDAPAGADAAKQKAEQQKAKRKELRDKQRELAHAAVEKQVQELERTGRMLSLEAALQRAGVELEAAQKELAVFLDDVKPRELEERRISLDGTTYYAEHQKDELGELTAMYEADEFARTTKELVLKRGRREMELADRRLSIARREFTHLEQIELPRRERELRHKVEDAELGKRKAELDLEKARLELDLAARKAAERTADLTEAIAELERELAAGEERP